MDLPLKTVKGTESGRENVGRKAGSKLLLQTGHVGYRYSSFGKVVPSVHKALSSVFQ